LQGKRAISGRNVSGRRTGSGRASGGELVIREGEHGEAPPAPEGLDPRLYELYAELWEMPESVLWRPEDANAVLLAREVAEHLTPLYSAEYGS
jgi:hypothetical protein